MRRFLTTILSLSLLLGLSGVGRLIAQDEKKDEKKTEAKPDDPKKDDAKTEKKDDAKKDDAKTEKKDDAKKDDAKPGEPSKDAQAKPAAPAQPTIPPEVEAKLEAARKAVAEAIVAAQDAGLVQTTIDPPPILDILITGRADDATTLKAVANKDEQAGVSAEVMCAWFTGFGKMDGVDASKNVRIMQPSKGLTDFYRQRSTVMAKHLADARKAKGEPPKAAAPAAKKEEMKKEETKPAEKKDEAKPAEKKKAEEKPKEEKKDGDK